MFISSYTSKEEMIIHVSLAYLLQLHVTTNNEDLSLVI